MSDGAALPRGDVLVGMLPLLRLGRSTGRERPLEGAEKAVARGGVLDTRTALTSAVIDGASSRYIVATVVRRVRSIVICGVGWVSAGGGLGFGVGFRV